MLYQTTIQRESEFNNETMRCTREQCIFQESAEDSKKIGEDMHRDRGKHVKKEQEMCIEKSNNAYRTQRGQSSRERVLEERKASKRNS